MMKELIGEKELAAARRRARRNAWIGGALAAALLALFIGLCLRTRTVNARRMTRTMIVSMTAGGWICLGWHLGMVKPSRAKARHLETVLKGEPEEFEGTFHMADAPAKIPGSVWVRRVTLEGPAHPETMEKPERKRLNLDEDLAGQAPGEGSRVRVRAAHGYITGLETTEGAERGNAPAARRTGKGRQALRRAGYFLPLLILWTLAVIVIGGFIFSRITDTAPKNKLVIYADCGVRNGEELGDRLEKELKDPIRMVQVRPFEYAMFQESGIDSADLYIVPASHAAEYRESFAPLPAGTETDGEPLELDGTAYGIPVWAPEEGIRAGTAWFEYEPEETYYLFFGRKSVHTAGNEDAADNRAADAAAYLLDTR